MTTRDLTSVLRVPALLGTALWVSACGMLPSDWTSENGYAYTSVEPLSDFGQASQELYAIITYWVVGIFIAVTALLAFTLLRFRDDGQGGNPQQIHGNTQMEIGWTLAPILIVLGLIIPTIRTIFEIADAPLGAMDENGDVMLDEDGVPLKPTVEIKVIGKRWWWAFEYVNEGIVTGNHLVIPDDRPVSLLITSDTVIHSFWTPRVGGKRDAVPGRVNPMWFNMTEDVAPGEVLHLRGECAEYCGEAHSLMRYEVLVLDGADYDTWVAEYQKGATFADAKVREEGEAAFAGAGCTGCHAVTGHPAAVGAIGPNLSFFGDRRYVGAGVIDMYDETPAADILTNWIRHPNELKPGTALLDNGTPRMDGMLVPVSGGDGIITEDELSKAEVDKIVAYLLAQKSSFPTPGVE